MTDTKTRALPAAVTLTARAEARIAELMAQAPAGAIGVKLSTPRRGCSGLAYSVDYITELVERRSAAVKERSQREALFHPGDVLARR